MVREVELLDFCRVKKIFEKGFGFLSSLYYKEYVFFHFSRIKDEETRAKLEKLKRGEVYVFYTSKLKDDKRKVAKVWLDVNKVDKLLIPAFIWKLIEELNDGKYNVFEIVHVLQLLKDGNYISNEDLRKILISRKISNNPTIILKLFAKEDLNKIENIEEIINCIGNGSYSYDKLVELILNKL